MKRRIITYLVFSLLCITSTTMAQHSIYGEINSTAYYNTIIRAWNDDLIIYGEDYSDRGYFHLLTDPDNTSTAIIIDMPDKFHVKDFKILNDYVYFVGESRGIAAYGYFYIYDVFYTGGIIKSHTLQGYPYHDEFGHSITIESTLLKRMEVYQIGQETHIVAIGEQSDGGSLTTAVFHIPVHSPIEYNFLTSGSGLGEGVFFDLALTDNYIVSVAHKGSPSNLLASGYIMMRAFDRNSDPLHSTSGQMRNDSDGYIYPNGSMAATATLGDQFAISCCQPLPTGTEHEYGIMDIGAGGVINPVLFERTNIGLSNASFYTLYDMAYNSTADALLDVGNVHSGWTLNTYSSSSSSYQYLSNPDFDINSLCLFQNVFCAASGKGTSGALGIQIQRIPIIEACGYANDETYFETHPKLRHYSGIDPKDAFINGVLTYNPTIIYEPYDIRCDK